MSRLVCDNQSKMEQAVALFLAKTARRRRFGHFHVTANRITYQTASYMSETVIATRIQREGEAEILLGNSAVLEDVGATHAWGRRRRNHSQTVIQRVLEKKIPMLPFSVFAETGLDISEIVIVDQKPAETVKRKVEKRDPKTHETVTVIEETHFTGASLFKLGEFYYLFDIDRNEIQHAIFNPFVAQIPVPVKTIEQAYQALKPAEVLKAERRGLKVQRQGEWFFIPVKDNFGASDLVTRMAQECRDRWSGMDESKLAMIEQLKGKAFRAKVERRAMSKGLPIRYELRAGRNRPNHATAGITKGKKSYVTGIVSHSGREHADLNLGSKWFWAIPNTATKSFTISGDVD